jgi:hypothetical protein
MLFTIITSYFRCGGIELKNTTIVYILAIEFTNYFSFSLEEYSIISNTSSLIPYRLPYYS